MVAERGAPKEKCPVLPKDGHRRQREGDQRVWKRTQVEKDLHHQNRQRVLQRYQHSPTLPGRTFQDTFHSPQMPASPTGGQGLTQEALIEVLRNQRQNIVQQQNLIAGQGAQISELTKLVSGLIQMQTDVWKDQAQREADERARKAEEERKAAEEAAAPSTPRTGSLFTSTPNKSGSSGGKMESYIPNCPQLEIKDSGRRNEINAWLSFRERFGSWLCLLDECYAAELQETVRQTTVIEQGKLAQEAAVRSSKLYHWMKQAMSGYKRGLDIRNNAGT